MTWQSWMFLYLLIGFVMAWVGHQLGAPKVLDWKTELAATILWPLSIVAAFLVPSSKKPEV